jgi:DNA-damage-inducible protein D
VNELIRATSPFDSIRRLRPDGMEYWSARELMPLLGYRNWQNFERAIEQAMVVAGSVDVDVDANFIATDRVSGTRGPASKDYDLSRYASYVTAMRGDSHKQEIADALTYFAVKTREAETAVPAPRLPDISTPAGVLAMAEQFAATARQLVAAEDLVAELQPKADLADTYLIAQGGSRLVREAAKLLGMREKDLRRFLLAEHLIFAKHAACGDIMYDHYAEFAHHFDARETIVNHTWGTCTHYTLRITPRGIDLIRKRLAAATS